MRALAGDYSHLWQLKVWNKLVLLGLCSDLILQADAACRDLALPPSQTRCSPAIIRPGKNVLVFLYFIRAMGKKP